VAQIAVHVYGLIVHIVVVFIVYYIILYRCKCNQEPVAE